ncbi:C1 family peptidase [Thermococcus sp.]|uniref:C1 family peptidase n=1 Tax=Thermococcus sp. TaxID=35749 RepID=UPI0026175417|nr:C1 family peptidase [Thermococcus sp.]
MNRKALSLLIAAVVVFSIVPLGFAATVQVPNTLNNSTLGPVVHGKDTTPITPNDMITSTYHRTGLKWIPLKEYEKVTGTHFKVMNPEAFKRALQNAPFYPRIDNGISGGKLTSTPEFSTTSLPKSVVNTVYLPPIGDQGYVGSCNAWSSTYYVWTYMLNWWRNNPFPTNPHDIMNPTFTYNLINGGEDQGSFPEDAMNLISTIGAVPESDFPVYAYPPESVIQAMKEGNMTPYYQWDEYVASVWPNLTQWEEAPHNKANYLTFLAGEYSENIPGQWYIVNLTNETQWNYLKGLLAKGYVLQTAIAVWSSFSYLDHPENVVEDMETYLNWTAEYIPEYWTNESYENGTYVNWTVGDMINQAVADYKEWANYTASSEQQYEKLMSQLNVSLALFLHVLTEKYNVSLSDTIPVAYQKLYDGVQVHFINNQSWWNNATFYLGTYSLGGEQWFLNHGFDSLYVIHNFELMVHHIPIGNYIYLVANLNFYNYDTPGGHAVTIIGYNDDMKTPDGEGALVMVNSWGTNWGRDGYWYFSYDAVRGAMANLTVDGILTLPNVTLTFGQAFVYVPKAANYQPKLLSVVGIHHPIRGETFSGFVVYNESNWDILAVPKEAGLDIGVSVNGSEYSIPFMDFVANYMWVPVQWVLSINYTNATQLASYIVQLAQWLALKYNLTYEYVLGALLGYPQVHPFPNSPMAFDVSDLGSYLTSYIDKTGKTPLYVDFYVNVSDALPDSVTGYLYNFTLLYQGPMETTTR